MNRFQNFLAGLAGLCLVVVFLVTFGQVIQRYVFHMAMPWASDVIRFFFVYSVFGGMVVGVFKKAHLNIDVLVQILPAHFRPWLAWVSDLVMLVFVSTILHYSIPFVRDNMDQMANYVQIPMGYMYAIVPVSCAIMAVVLLLDVRRGVRGPTDGSDGRGH